ncbi:MAG: gas vesicle protein [Actinophytocola sp.]|nr:gas vesicle protein [Actinophytocola sp.]
MTDASVPEVRYASAPGGSREPVTTLALIDLLDRVLAGGVVISGDITLAIEGVDLVHISLRALVGSVRAPSLAEPS